MQHARSSITAAWRPHLWFALLVAAAIAFSLGFACAMPFVAFGAYAAWALPRRDAVLLIGAIWLANQIVGFAVLGYPWDANTLAWCAALGGVAVAATLVARAAAAAGASTGRIGAACAAFLAAFIVYEVALFAVAATLLGGVEDFTPSIIGRILGINAAAMIGLLVLDLIGRATGVAAAPALRGFRRHRPA
jgi:hypothetical protein